MSTSVDLISGAPANAEALARADALVLIDGTPLALRPIDADDRGRLADLFNRLSPETRYRRFLIDKPHLSERELDYLTDIDHVRNEAIVAVDRRDGSLVGVARYAAYPGRADVADFAIVVTDELQGIGLGPVLARRLLRRAYVNCFERLTATTLWGNLRARRFLAALGFHSVASSGPEIDLELVLDPGSLAPSR